MIDIGLSKLALIGAVALIVIGPEKLPRVARTVGTLLGKAQRYVADVKSEVNRSIELEELSKVREQFETAARDVSQSVSSGLNDATRDVNAALGQHVDSDTPTYEPYNWDSTPAPAYKPPKKNWRIKRSAVPQWYKKSENVRRHVQSGAARVARFRPARSTRSL